MQDARIGTHDTTRYGTEVIHFEFNRGEALPCFEGGHEGQAHRHIRQITINSTVHRTHWIIVIHCHNQLNRRFSCFDAYNFHAQELADGESLGGQALSDFIEHFLIMPQL